MATELMVKKINKEIRTLRRDISQVKKLIFRAFPDLEGEYRTVFVKKIEKRVVEAVEILIKEGKDKAMSLVNAG